MILHSLAGAVESEGWQARGQDCRHRESWQGPFHMSLAGHQGRDRNLLQEFQGGMGLSLRQGRASGQRYCIQFSRVCRQQIQTLLKLVLDVQRISQIHNAKDMYVCM